MHAKHLQNKPQGSKTRTYPASPPRQKRLFDQSDGSFKVESSGIGTLQTTVSGLKQGSHSLVLAHRFVVLDLGFEQDSFSVLCWLNLALFSVAV